MYYCGVRSEKLASLIFAGKIFSITQDSRKKINVEGFHYQKPDSMVKNEPSQHDVLNRGLGAFKQFQFLAINKPADSLYSLIADGKYRATSLYRDTWNELIGTEASLQENCKKKGSTCFLKTTPGLK